jgi:hypothetical protein
MLEKHDDTYSTSAKQSKHQTPHLPLDHHKTQNVGPQTLASQSSHSRTFMYYCNIVAILPVVGQNRINKIGNNISKTPM